MPECGMLVVALFFKNHRQTVKVHIFVQVPWSPVVEVERVFFRSTLSVCLPIGHFLIRTEKQQMKLFIIDDDRRVFGKKIRTEGSN